MQTDDHFNPLPYEIDHCLFGLGKNVLLRMRSLRRDKAYGQERLVRLRADIRDFGVPGMISLISAMIGDKEYDRSKLLRQGREICGQDMFCLFEEILDLFEGRRPCNDIWHRDESGYYHLT